MRGIGPGLLFAVLLAAVSHALGAFTDLPVLALSVLAGALVANVMGTPKVAVEGLRWGAKHLLRLGIVLLGLELSLGDIGELGWARVIFVVVTVVITFLVTIGLGKLLGISRGLSFLTAAGFSICGASAIIATREVVESEEDDVAYALALVTVCGSLAILVLPLVMRASGLTQNDYGMWVGASVHDVAQVVAAGSIGGVLALKLAVAVKLTRVILLAPMLVILGALEKKRGASRVSSRAPLVPLFVVGFLAASLVRNSEVLPEDLLVVFEHLQTGLFAIALVGLGAGVQFSRLRILGLRPLILGLGSWFAVAAISYVGVAAL